MSPEHEALFGVALLAQAKALDHARRASRLGHLLDPGDDFEVWSLALQLLATPTPRGWA